MLHHHLWAEEIEVTRLALWVTNGGGGSIYQSILGRHDLLVMVVGHSSSCKVALLHAHIYGHVAILLHSQHLSLILLLRCHIGAHLSQKVLLLLGLFDSSLLLVEV